ncbi:DUF6090 family protein [Algibacter luteus]|uniref:Uncharacterized protein n=1 Tax=Algibacter luteus TaxID=1178825 RepID=A0A1M6FAJ9_9FLAO|nr:DUF6090 family protein [Algibacter luteus]SHI94702.1 hypothetical protein SAMN05216261_2284 [Algibacter luteus]
MIKFFRKIRQNLLSEGKTGKYLKYAIGEIVLVVIGILIALQINNWNENKNNNAKIETLFEQVLQELEQDIKAIDGTIFYLNKKDSIAKLILESNYKINEVTGFQYGELTDFFKMSHNFSQSTNDYNSLMNAINIIPKKYNSILKNLTPLYTYNAEKVYEPMESLTNLNDDIKKNFMFNQPWYYDVLSKKPNKEAFAFVEQALFKNMVASYKERNIKYIESLIFLKSVSIISYAELHDAIFSEKPLPKFMPRHAIKISNDKLETYSGCYKTGRIDLDITIERKGNFLAFGDSGTAHLLLSINENGDFIAKINKTSIINFNFSKDDAGNVYSVKTIVNGQITSEFIKLKNCD